MKYDHHNGQTVKSVAKGNITFDSGETIETSAEELPGDLRGLTLLAVEGDEDQPLLIFGTAQGADENGEAKAAIRVHEVVGRPEATENDSRATDEEG